MMADALPPAAGPDPLSTLEALLAAADPAAVVAALGAAARAAGATGVIWAETTGLDGAAFDPVLTRVAADLPAAAGIEVDRFLARPELRRPIAPGAELAGGAGVGPARLVPLPPRPGTAAAILAYLWPRGPATGAAALRDWQQHGRALRALAGVAGLRLAALAGAVPVAAALRPRQREVLGWIAAGKTTEEVAVILGVTRGAVEKHLRLARERLSAASTVEAVAKSIRLNMI